GLCPGQNFHQRGFSCAVLPQQRVDFARIDGQRDVVEGAHAGILLADMAHLQHGRRDSCRQMSGHAVSFSHIYICMQRILQTSPPAPLLRKERGAALLPGSSVLPSLPSSPALLPARQKGEQKPDHPLPPLPQRGRGAGGEGDPTPYPLHPIPYTLHTGPGVRADSLHRGRRGGFRRGVVDDNEGAGARQETTAAVEGAYLDDVLTVGNLARIPGVDKRRRVLRGHHMVIYSVGDGG